MGTFRTPSGEDHAVPVSESQYMLPPYEFVGPHFLGVFYPQALTFSLPPPLLSGLPEPWGEGLDRDILLRADCSKISNSLHDVWLRVLFPSIAGGSFSDDDGRARCWSTNITEGCSESFYCYSFVCFRTVVFGFTLGPRATSSQVLRVRYGFYLME